MWNKADVPIVLAVFLAGFSFAQEEPAPRIGTVHVVVALCDNANQGIVPVPAELGDGQDPRRNLYWGARYGVANHLPRRAGWREARRLPDPAPPGVLDRLVLQKRIGDKEVFLVAEAWDGRRMRGAVERFLELAAGRDATNIVARGERGATRFEVGGGGGPRGVRRAQRAHGLPTAPAGSPAGPSRGARRRCSPAGARSISKPG